MFINAKINIGFWVVGVISGFLLLNLLSFITWAQASDQIKLRFNQEQQQLEIDFTKGELNFKTVDGLPLLYYIIFEEQIDCGSTSPDLKSYLKDNSRLISKIESVDVITQTTKQVKAQLTPSIPGYYCVYGELQVNSSEIIVYNQIQILTQTQPTGNFIFNLIRNGQALQLDVNPPAELVVDNQSWQYFSQTQTINCQAGADDIYEFEVLPALDTETAGTSLDLSTNLTNYYCVRVLTQSIPQTYVYGLYELPAEELNKSQTTDWNLTNILWVIVAALLFISLMFLVFSFKNSRSKKKT